MHGHFITIAVLYSQYLNKNAQITVDGKEIESYTPAFTKVTQSRNNISFLVQPLIYPSCDLQKWIFPFSNVIPNINV